MKPLAVHRRFFADNSVIVEDDRGTFTVPFKEDTSVVLDMTDHPWNIHTEGNCDDIMRGARTFTTRWRDPKIDRPVCKKIQTHPAWILLSRGLPTDWTMNARQTH